MISTLEMLVSDPATETILRVETARTLHSIGPPARGVAPTLIRLLEDERDPKFRAVLVQAIGVLDPSSVEVLAVLRSLRSDPDPVVSAMARIALFQSNATRPRATPKTPPLPPTAGRAARSQGFFLAGATTFAVQTMALLAGRGAGFPEVVTVMATTLLASVGGAMWGLGDRCRYPSGPVGSAVLGFATTGGSLWVANAAGGRAGAGLPFLAVLAGAGFGLAGAVAACMLRSEARARKLRVGDGPQVSKLRRWPAARA